MRQRLPDASEHAARPCDGPRLPPNGLATRDDVEGVADLRTLSGVGRHHQPPALHANQDDGGYGDRELARTVGTAGRLGPTGIGACQPGRVVRCPTRVQAPSVRRRCGRLDSAGAATVRSRPPWGQGTDAAAGKRQERGASEDHPPRCPPHAGIRRQTRTNAEVAGRFQTGPPARSIGGQPGRRGSGLPAPFPGEGPFSANTMRVGRVVGTAVDDERGPRKSLLTGARGFCTLSLNPIK